MTPRPTFRPSSTGPRLPISIDPDGLGQGQVSHTRPLPSPSPSPSFDEQQPSPIPLENRPRVRRLNTSLERDRERDHRSERPNIPRSASSEYRHRQHQRVWEEGYHPTRQRQSPSISTSSPSTNMMLPASAQHTPLPQRDLPAMDGYFSGKPRNDYQTFQPPLQSQPPRSGTLSSQPTPHVISISEAPRNSNGSKKQQSGRKRTACDRCKRQKSSVSAKNRRPHG